MLAALDQRLKTWAEKGLFRQRRTRCPGDRAVDFSSNDYLGLQQHPAMIQAMQSALSTNGVGSTGSPLLSGYTALHAEVESAFSEWLGVDAAMLFNSGYHANLGVLTTFLSRHDAVLSDKLCHASLLDGIQLSRAKHFRYPHCDTDALAHLVSVKSPKCIVTEGVFSMEGSIAPLQKICKIADQAVCGLIVDDAHGIGVLGEGGRGSVAFQGLTQRTIVAQIFPLGKAFCGLGAVVAGSQTMIESLLQFARQYRYSTALPPVVAAGILSALRIIQADDARREKLQHNIRYFKSRAADLGYEQITQDITPIQSIIFRDNDCVMRLRAHLEGQGFIVAAIRPPTVPEGTARLRISLTALHTERMITNLLYAIKAVENL